MHMNYARELHNEGILELNAWANISKFLEREEHLSTEEGEQPLTEASA